MSLLKNEPLLYRFGFVCVPASELPTGEPWKELRAEWKPAQICDLLVLAHPESPITLISDSALLIGNAFAVGDDRSAEALLETAIAAGSDSVLHETLDILSGRFALITSQGGGRVYHDAFGSRTIFYRVGQPSCTASHGGLIAGLFGATVDPLAEAISREPEYVSRSVAYLPGDLSVHDGVRALTPNNYYDISSGRTVRYWPRVPRKKTTLNQFHSCADTYFSSFAAYLSNHHLTPVLGVTAGIDSRAIIAAFRHHNVPMKYVTWKNVALPEKDVAVAKAMASYLGGQHHLLPERGQGEDETFYRISDLAGKNVGHFSGRNDVGHFSGRSRITAYMYQTFEGQSDLVFIRGYGAEILRGFYNLGRQRIEEMSVAELVRAYNTSVRIERSPSEKYIKLASEAVEQFMLRANYEGLERFDYDLSDLYYWEHRMGMWGSSMQNEMDAAMLSMAGFNNRCLFESAFGLEPSERLTEGLLLDLTRRYDEGLAMFPINPSKSRQNANKSPSNKQLREKLKAERERNKALKERLEKLRSELREARREHQRSTQERNYLKHLYLEIKQSRFWRYTLAVRKIVGALKRVLRG